MDLNTQQINELFKSIQCFPTFTESVFTQILSDYRITIGPSSNIADINYNKNIQIILNLLAQSEISNSHQSSINNSNEITHSTDMPFQVANDAQPPSQSPTIFTIESVVKLYTKSSLVKQVIDGLYAKHISGDEHKTTPESVSKDTDTEADAQNINMHYVYDENLHEDLSKMEKIINDLPFSQCNAITFRSNYKENERYHNNTKDYILATYRGPQTSLKSSKLEEEDKLEVDPNEESLAQPIKTSFKPVSPNGDDEENIKASFVQTNFITHRNKIEKRYVTEATQTVNNKKPSIPPLQINYSNCILM